MYFSCVEKLDRMCFVIVQVLLCIKVSLRVFFEERKKCIEKLYDRGGFIAINKNPDSLQNRDLILLSVFNF